MGWGGVVLVVLGRISLLFQRGSLCALTQCVHNMIHANMSRYMCVPKARSLSSVTLALVGTAGVVSLDPETHGPRLELPLPGGLDPQSGSGPRRSNNVHESDSEDEENIYTLEDDPMDPENHWLVEENNLPGGQDVKVYVSFRECKTKKRRNHL